MRVITTFGLGEAPALWSVQEHVTVHLDQPVIDGRTTISLRNSEVYPFSLFAFARILNVDGAGIVSRLMFVPTARDLESADWRSWAPPNETSVKLDLESGLVTMNHQLGLAVGRYFIIRPWIDRWAIERSSSEDIDTKDAALGLWRAERESCAGTSGGIQASALIDIEMRQVLGLRLIIAPPQGIVYDWPER